MTDWANQDLVFTYYFPNYGDVFTGSPIAFVADGTQHLSTLANLSPATFSVTPVQPGEVQIAYLYPAATYPNGITMTDHFGPFNGFTISGPAGLAPIVGVSIDSGNTVPGLTLSQVAFTADSVTINLVGLKLPAGSVGLVDVNFTVPELGSGWMLMLGAFALLAIARFPRRSRSAA